jgi:SAM-dependent methyltransferase
VSCSPGCVSTKEMQVLRTPIEWDHMQEAYWDKVSLQYDQLYLDRWSLLEDQDLLEHLLQIPISTERVLELACGTGFGYRLIGPTCFVSYIGTDISAGMIEQFRSRHPDADVRRMSIHDSTRKVGNGFSSVLCLNTSMSFDTETSLAEIRLLLASQGVFVGSYLSKWSLRRLLKLRFGVHERYTTRGGRGHSGSAPSRVWSKSELSQQAALAGFSDIVVVGRSAFGGLCQAPVLYRLDKLICRIFPDFGHELLITARAASS